MRFPLFSVCQDPPVRGLFVRSVVALILLALPVWMDFAPCCAETITREGVHLRLTSDVKDAPLMEDLVSSFDAAVPQWLAFWGLPAERSANWKVNGFLMRDASAFRDSGDLPPAIPSFQNGFATPTTIWVHFQQSDYYNRHLILHEGVHALAFELFGGGGPSWYMEGTAELLATHRDRNESSRPASPGVAGGLLAQAANEFRINQLPASPEESPLWGRYRVVDTARAAGTMPGLASILKLPTDLEGNVQSYTWCWAAAMMLTAYPDSRDAFISAASGGDDSSPAFTARFYRRVNSQWPALRARWRVWLDDLEYGFDRERSLVNLSTEDPRADGSPRTLQVDAARGWQSAGVWFPTGTVKVRSSGECVIVAKENMNALDPAGDALADGAIERDWISTPAGITIARHRGSPIGQLQVCVLPIPSSDDDPVAPLDIHLPTTANGLVQVESIRIDRPSWLLFRVNDVPGDRGRYQRADNRGGYQVQIAH